MINTIIQKLINKDIAILGFGKEGQSTYEFIRKYLPNIHLTIIDQNDNFKANYPSINQDQNVSFITGNDYLNNLENFDVIIKSPGISLKDIDITELQSKLTSQMELVLEVNSQNVIGVTGTKGKSTTSSLIYEMIKAQNQNVVLAGNIGIPILSELEKCDENTIIVAEMSSHQLEYVHYSPHIGVVLNLFEDHLDHAGTIEHYHEIKLHMFSYQTASDYMVYCSDNKTLNELIKKHSFKGIPYIINQKNTDEKAIVTKKDNFVYYNNSPIFDVNTKTNLLGEHNLENIMVALTIGKILNLDESKMIEVIQNFKPLDYRLQNIGTVNSVDYYVDTLATIPQATIQAIEALKNVNTLIFGGMDRGINYEDLIYYLKICNIKNYICMPTTGYVIGKHLENIDNKNIYYLETLKEAVILAKQITEPNTICLLSPAAPSYEHFKNYKDKGDKFKEYVLNKNI